MPKTTASEDTKKGSASSSSSSSSSSSGSALSSTSNYDKWDYAAWRRSGFVPVDRAAIAERAVALGNHTPAVLTSASSTGKSKSATVTGKGKKAKKAPKAQKEKSKSESNAAAAALATITPRQTFNTLFAATHSRLAVGSPFVTGHCYYEAVSASSEL